MKKILINKNALQADEVVANLKRQAEYLNSNIAPDLAGLGIEMTPETLADLLFNDCQIIQAKFSKQVEADLREVQNPILRKSHLKVTQEAMEEFLKKTYSIKHVQKEDLLSVQNGAILLTAENEKTLRESFCHYLTDPEEIQKYEQLQAVCDALNVFYAGKPFGFWNDYFGIEEGHFIPKNTLNYSEVVRITKAK